MVKNQGNDKKSGWYKELLTFPWFLSKEQTWVLLEEQDRSQLTHLYFSDCGNNRLTGFKSDFELCKCIELALLLMCVHLPDRTVQSPGSITDPLKALVHHAWIWLSLLSGCSLSHSQHYITERNLWTHSTIHHSPTVHIAWMTGCHYILMLPMRDGQNPCRGISSWT